MKAKKSLGQNFLHYPKATRRIAEIVRDQNIPITIEIGPGKGALTKEILENTPTTIYAVELDPRMQEILQEKFATYIESGRLSIIHQDILETSVETLVNKAPYGVVGNIPFYITGAIIKKFLTEKHQPSYMTLITQKEVAERIAKRDGKESILSLSVQIFSTPKYEMKIPKKYFSPAPNVDAALITMNTITRDNMKDISEERFFEIVKSGFAHKRKKLSSNIKHCFAAPVAEVFQACNITENARAEEIPLEKWIELSKK